MCILITSIFCCCVIHCVILAHNCLCNKLTNIVYIYRFRKNIEMETSKIKSRVICVAQKRWKDVVGRKENFFFVHPKSHKFGFPPFYLFLSLLYLSVFL